MIHDFETARFDATVIPPTDDRPVDESKADPPEGAVGPSVGSSSDTDIYMRERSPLKFRRRTN